MPFRSEVLEAIGEMVEAAGDLESFRRARENFIVAMHRHPEEWRQKYLHARSLDELRADAVLAFDQIGSLKLKVWILIGAVTAEGAVISWLATALLACINELHGPLHAVLRSVH